MFTLVNYVRLSPGYIRGRFVLKQRQFLIGRATSVQIQWSLALWIVSSMSRDMFLVFCDFKITMRLHWRGNFVGIKWEDQSLSSVYLHPFQIKDIWVYKYFCFFWHFAILRSMSRRIQQFSKNPSVIRIWPEHWDRHFLRILGHFFLYVSLYGTRKGTGVVAWPSLMEDGLVLLQGIKFNGL